MPVSHTTKPLAMGAARRWQGYAARDGFGMTRIKNHSSDTAPTNGNAQKAQRCPLRLSIKRPVFGQILLAFSSFPHNMAESSKKECIHCIYVN
jgi:hypothetical protein